MSKYRNTVYYDLKFRFLVIFLVITGTVYCWKYRFPTIFFSKSRNTVLKIFISRPPENTTPPLGWLIIQKIKYLKNRTWLIIARNYGFAAEVTFK